MHRIFIAFAAATVLFSYCSDRKSKNTEESPIKFTSLSPSQTNITFDNKITEDDSVNLIYNAYAYMGSGVGIGDFNNDGLQDVFFGANQESCKLYLNKGNLSFEDITEKAGLNTSSWVTGVSIVDINADGFDDIYLCVSYYG
ncbi:MAG: VCBS repeat-containing protein, partial [Chitinophagaceae bacterium]|nr:VCBS repeat-containing protein [Chitinophagaceae bacterium]